MSSSELEWKYEDAKEAYDLVLPVLGTPTVLCKEKGGIAIWYEKDLKDKKYYGEPNCYHEVVLRDESVKHMCPAHHRDFLYTYIVVPVEPKQIHILSGVSGSVSYDPLKNTVSARCGSLEANIATLKLCTDLLLDKKVSYPEFDISYKNLEEADKNDAYIKLIKITKSEDAAATLYKSLCKNVKELNKKGELNKGYWKGAFSRVGDTCLPPDKTDKLDNRGAKKRKSRRSQRSRRSRRGSKKSAEEDKSGETTVKYKYRKYKTKYLNLKKF